MLEMDGGTGTRQDSMTFSLRDVTAPLFRRKRFLVVTFLFLFAAAALLGLHRLHKYESHMAILVSRERLDPLVTTEATSQMGAMTPALTDQEVNSEAELLKSRDLLEDVVLANGIQNAHGSPFLNFFRPTGESRSCRASGGDTGEADRG